MSTPRGKSRLGECPTCEGEHTVGSGRPNGVDCRCGRHFHFGDALWTRTDECIVCPSCERALSPLDFGPDGQERGEFVVTFTPGPPAIGVATERTVAAASAAEAEAIIKGQHRWAMVHKVRAA